MLRVLQRDGWLGAFGRPLQGTQIPFAKMRLSQTEKPEQHDRKAVPRDGKDETNQQTKASMQE